MKDISDILTVSFDNGLKDESALCVTRKQGGDYSILKMELGEQADILHYLLTNQIAKAEIKTEKWIPVSERLPEVGIDVLVCDEEGDIWFSHRSSFGWFIDECGNKIKDIRAWMSLPEPYEPKEVEE